MTTMTTFIVTNNNGTNPNATLPGRTQTQQVLVDVTQKLILFIVVIIMIGVGCSLDLKKLVMYLRRPKEFFTGLCLQLFGMPLAGLAITQMLRMDTPEALGVIIQSISPGGAYSNLVTYWLDGELNLSVVMTGTSSFLAFASMSFWLLIISKILKLEQQLLVPYQSVGIGAASTTLPLIVGLIFRHFFPRTAPKITKVFSIIGSIGVIVAIALFGVAGVYDYPFSQTVFVAAILLITVAVLFGYAASRVPWLNLEPSCRRTIAIETVYQNTAVALSVIVLSFSSADPDVFGPMIFFPVFYFLLLISLSLVVIVVYKIAIAKGVECLSPPVNSDKKAESTEEVGTSDGLMQEFSAAVVIKTDIDTSK